MTLDRRFLNWGVFFIVLGAVPLAVRADLISRDVLSGVWRLWPLILVGIGVGIMLRRTPAAFAGGLIVAATVGLVAGSGLAVGTDVIANCGDAPGSGTTFQQHGTFSGSASVDLHLGCGTVDVTTATGSDWTLDSRNSRNVGVDLSSSPGNLSVHSGRSGDIFGSSGRDDWRLALPTDARIDLSAEVNAGKATFDLASATLNGFSLTVNAGDAHADFSAVDAVDMSVTVNAGNASVSLPSGGDTNGSMTVNAGSLNICAPPGVGLRFNVSQGLAGTNFESAGLRKSGNVWQSQDYGATAHNADLSITANLGGVTLNPTGGCK